MQISAAQSSPWSSLPMSQHPAAAEAPGQLAVADIEVPAAQPGGDIVSLSAVPGTATATHANMATPEVFAEIWKNGMKIGAVYTNGEASVAGGLGGSPIAGGAMFAQLRAEQLSREVGGEVRYVNIAALRVEQTRSQLRTAYGV